MKKLLIPVLAAALLMTACGPEKGIEVHEIWMRPAAQGENAAVYFVLHNHASQADAITGVTAEDAEAAETHESRMNGDVMEMHPLDTVPLAAYAEVVFEPGGLHIMLIGLKKDLKTGDETRITLHFKNAKDLTFLAPVRDTPAPEEEHSSDEH